MITAQYRVAWRSETRGRSYLTVEAALRNECFAQIREKRCDCDEADYHTGYPGSTCSYHDPSPEDGMTHGQKVADRFVRFYRHIVRAAVHVEALVL